MNNLFSKIPWLKIIGWSILLHIILIVLSILEVFIYSLIKPGHDNSFYEEHAKLSGPYISIIFGFVLFFFVARLLCKNRLDNKIVIALALPVIYTVMDFLIVHLYGVDWAEHLLVFTISFLTKMLGAYLGVISLGKKPTAV